jgi:curved DNA-binding protein
MGAVISVPTPAGKVELKVPPNSSGGRKLRLKNRGIPAKTPGDLYVVLQIALPKAETEAERSAYAEFKQAFDFNPRTSLGI